MRLPECLARIDSNAESTPEASAGTELGGGDLGAASGLALSEAARSLVLLGTFGVDGVGFRRTPREPRICRALCLRARAKE